MNEWRIKTTDGDFLVRAVTKNMARKKFIKERKYLGSNAPMIEDIKLEGKFYKL